MIAHNPGPERIIIPHCPSGAAVRLVQTQDSFSEGVFIAKEIARMAGGVDMLEAQALDHEGPVRAFSDMAVLCRTHRQLELVEKCLAHDDIPCVVSGREDFLEDPTVRGMLAFFRSLMVPSDRAALESALRLVWDWPCRPAGTGPGTLPWVGTVSFGSSAPRSGWLWRALRLAGPSGGVASLCGA